MLRVVSLTLASLVSFAASSSAQIPCQAEYADDAYADGSFMGGPNGSIAIQFVAPVDFSATSIEFFTGEGTGQNSVQLWSDDAALNQPASVLGSATWNLASANGWQGATVSPPVALTAGTTYWVGWSVVYHQQSSSYPPLAGNGPVYRGSWNGGQTWTGPFQNDVHWKYRIWGGCTGPISYCTAKINQLSCLPTITSFGTPSTTAASGFEVRAINMRNQRPGLMMYSVAGRAAMPFQYGYLCVASPVRRTPGTNSGGSWAPYDCSGVYSIDMNAFAQGMLGGTPSPALLVPGTTVDCQWWGRDVGSAQWAYSLTGGLEYVL